MKRNRHAEEQIITILKAPERGASIAGRPNTAALRSRKPSVFGSWRPKMPA